MSRTALNFHPCAYDAYGMTLVEAAAFGATVPEHHYQAAHGLPELQDALRDKLAAENDIAVAADQIMRVEQPPAP